jgi:hypothetical protein
MVMNSKFGIQGLGYRSAVLAALVSVCSSSFLSGCSRSDAPEAAAAPTLVLDAVPSGIRDRDTEFDGKIRMLGFKYPGKQKTMRAGSRVTIALYWQANAKVEPGYKMVTRLVDAAGETVLDLDNAGPLREQKDGRPLMPPESWVPGKVYVDELTFTVPKSVKSWQVQLISGFAKGDEKLKITSPAEPIDGLALLATSGTGVRGKSQKPRRLPDLRVDVLSAKSKIKIDGKLDEAEWKEAPATTLVDVTTGVRNKKSPLGGNVRVLWNQQGMYVAFEAQDADVVGGFKKTDKDPHLWTKDTVEIMVDPDGDGDNKDYYEVQINPQNLVFDTQYDDYNQPRQEPDGPFGHQEWSSGVKSAVTINGTLDKSDDKDEGYVVEAFLPWKSFSKAKKAPPALGDSWRMNFYVIQENAAVAWSPILKAGNFHKASRFGTVLFASKDWAPPAASGTAELAPAAEGSGAAAPPPPSAAAGSKAPLVGHVEAAKTKPVVPAAADPAPATPPAAAPAASPR